METDEELISMGNVRVKCSDIGKEVKIEISVMKGSTGLGRALSFLSRGQIRQVEILEKTLLELEKKHGSVIPIYDIISSARKGGIDRKGCMEAIKTLKKAGEIFEPRTGFIQRI